MNQYQQSRRRSAEMIFLWNKTKNFLSVFLSSFFSDERKTREDITIATSSEEKLKIDKMKSDENNQRKLSFKDWCTASKSFLLADDSENNLDVIFGALNFWNFILYGCFGTWGILF